MLGFHSISETSLSTLVTADYTSTTYAAASLLSATGASSVGGVLNIGGLSAIDVSGSIVVNGTAFRLAKAKLGSADAFTAGFTKGFLKANFIVGAAHIDGAKLIVATSISANAALPAAKALLPASATFVAAANPFGGARLDITASLSPNSVLLIKGTAEVLSASSTLNGILVSPNERADLVPFTLYLDKTRDIEAFIRKSMSLDGLVDKQLLLSAYLDKQDSLTGYIDKQLEKDFVRER
tara:strand:- start:1335 stop:2051 length:717 start_codon:yes stop_codon:yes gene_type:complete